MEVSSFDNVTQVSLSCEMSLYLRPEEDLQWFRGEQLIVGDSGRLSLTYSAGTAQGQFGGDTVGLSRVSTLVISQPQTSDSGTYTCTIRNTPHSQDIQLTVESAGKWVQFCNNPPHRIPFRTAQKSLLCFQSTHFQPHCRLTMVQSCIVCTVPKIIYGGPLIREVI